MDFVEYLNPIKISIKDAAMPIGFMQWGARHSVAYLGVFVPFLQGCIAAALQYI